MEIKEEILEYLKLRTRDSKRCLLDQISISTKIHTQVSPRLHICKQATSTSSLLFLFCLLHFQIEKCSDRKPLSASSATSLAFCHTDFSIHGRTCTMSNQPQVVLDLSSSSVPEMSLSALDIASATSMLSVANYSSERSALRARSWFWQSRGHRPGWLVLPCRDRGMLSRTNGPCGCRRS